MRATLAALTLAVTLLGLSTTQAQCPTCGPQYGHHNYPVGEYSRYGGFDAHAYYKRSYHGGYSDAGDCVHRHYGETDLFRQYYIGNNCGGVPAAMYPAPNTNIPAHVGHTYYTYEPLYPHEFLYPHQRTYHRYYNDGRGLTRAKVTWMKSPALAGLAVIPFHW